jgi:uncharacterized protein YyaL (SSP411 family)
LGALAHAYLPNVVILFKPAGEADVAAHVEALAPFTRGMKEVDGSPAAYVCTGGRCLKPVTSPADLLRLIWGHNTHFRISPSSKSSD